MGGGVAEEGLGTQFRELRWDATSVVVELGECGIGGGFRVVGAYD